MPAALGDQGYRLRPETEADLPFILALYASTRADEIAQMTIWSDDQKRQFIEQQFNAQRFHYQNRIANCAFAIIEHRGAPIGRLYLQPRQTQLHVTDIALMPDWRGRGIGTAMLRALMDAADAEGKGLGIFVEKFNPALRLYRRLGFDEIADTGVYLEMEWRRAPLDDAMPKAS